MEESKTTSESSSTPEGNQSYLGTVLLGAGCVGAGAVGAVFAPAATTVVVVGGATFFVARLAGDYFFSDPKKKIFGNAEVTKELETLFEAVKDLSELELKRGQLNWHDKKFLSRTPAVWAKNDTNLKSFYQDAWYFYNKIVVVKQHCAQHRAKQTEIQCAARAIKAAIDAGPSRRLFQDVWGNSNEIDIFLLLRKIKEVSPGIVPFLNLYLPNLANIEEAMQVDNQILDKMQPYMQAYIEGFELHVPRAAEIMVISWINLLILEKSGWARKLDQDVSNMVIKQAVSTISQGIVNQEIYPFLEMDRMYYLVRSIIDPHFKLETPALSLQIKKATKQKIQSLIKELEVVLNKSQGIDLGLSLSEDTREPAYLSDALSSLIARDMKVKLTQFFCDETDEASLSRVKEKLCKIIILALIEKEEILEKKDTNLDLVTACKRRGDEKGCKMAGLVKESMTTFAKLRYGVEEVSKGLIKPTSYLEKFAYHFTSWVSGKVATSMPAATAPVDENNREVKFSVK